MYPFSYPNIEKFDTEYKPGAQAIYKEFALRTTWNRIKNHKDPELYCRFIDDAWEEYTFIFTLESTRISFPSDMVWVSFGLFFLGLFW